MKLWMILLVAGVAVAAGVLLWIFSFRGRSLNRVEGGLLLLGYLGYFIYLL